MNIDFTCQKCESSFEIDAQDLLDGTEKLACPHCNAKAPASLTDDFISALNEIRAQVTAMASRFAVSLSLESEELESELDAEEDEDIDEDEDLEEAEDELEFDDDDEVDEDDDYDDEDSDD